MSNHHLDEHTHAKHVLLERYLQAWVTILGRNSEKLMYVDGFSFTGRYTTGGPGGHGGPGSPLIALKVFKEVDPPAQGWLTFIERDEETAATLEANVAAAERRERDRTKVLHGDFGDEVLKVLDWLERQPQPPPSFFFIDPYGVKGVSMGLIRRILAIPRAEVFINLMWVRTGLSLTKALGDDLALAAKFDELFGDASWRTLGAATEARFKNDLRALFMEKCRSEVGGNAKHVQSFAVHRGDTDALVYWLVFCTNSDKGLEEMKRAMWKVDETGAYKFGSSTASGAPMLFSAEVRASSMLPQLLMTEFGGRPPVPISEIEDFVTCRTPFLSTHLRKHGLDRLLADGHIEVSRPAGSRSGYPDGTTVAFTAASEEPTDTSVQG